MSQDLHVLLRLGDKDFWHVVKRQPTLATALDTFLRFRRRAYDTQETPSLDSFTLNKLAKQVTVPEKSQASFRHQQAEWLYDQWMTDVPKIFDLCVLYGRENRALMQSLLQKLFQLQPKCLDDLHDAVTTLVDNLYFLQERCNASLVQIMQGNEVGLLGWTDVMKYVLDVSVNVIALLELYPLAGGRLMQNGGMLLCSLANLHDILLPQFDGAVRGLGLEGGEEDDLLKQVHLTMAALQKTCYILLKAAYLTGDAQEGSSASKQVLADRGQQLMSVIMAIAELEERDVTRSLLHKMNNRFHLGDLIIEAIEQVILPFSHSSTNPACIQGCLSLDDAQFDYLSLIVQSKTRPHSLRPLAKNEKLPVSVPATGSSSQPPDDLQRATLLSKISEIKDVLPDHGDGFLERCLHEFRMDTEQVIAHLLDDSLPPSLSSLDPYMPLSDFGATSAPREGASSSSAANGTADPQAFYKQFLFPDSLGPGWNATYNEKPPQTTDIQKWAQVKVGAPPRKKVDRKTARVLDQASSEIRQIVIRQANELLVDDYDDEYDDSYDDLGTQGGADGQADVEGDDSRETQEKSQKPYFVKDGKIYHAPKEGAVAVQGLLQAQTTANRRDEVIHGLGAGGNLPSGDASENPVPDRQPMPPRGRGRGRGRSRGGNHHRKQRNLRKQGM